MKIWRQVPANAMSIFSSNSAFKLGRALIIPWAEMKVGCIKCSNKRDFSSSFPVRYTPGKKLESGESERISPAKVTKPSYSSNEQSSRVEFSRNRFIPDSTQTCRVESMSRNESMNFGEGLGVCKAIDFQEPFEDDSIFEEPDEFMHEVRFSEEEEEQNDEYSLVQGNSIIQQDVEKLEKLAAKIIAKRAFTAFELRKKLLAKHFPRVIVDAVILDFKKRGLVNDGLYAEAYSRSKWTTSTWGPGRIKKGLHDKGVKNEDAEKAVKLTLNDTNSAEGEESALGMSQDAMKHLLVQASKQWLRSVDMPRETRKSRIISWLQYRGFNWNIIINVLKKLESGHHL